MNDVKRLKLSLSLGNEKVEMGELVEDNRHIYFKYYPDFIEKNLLISPFKLPLSSDILTPDTTIFDGLYGVFFDSLPDGWGRLLVDRALIERDLSLSNITALDRLSFVGDNGMGAISYEPVFDTDYNFDHKLELDFIAQETNKVLEGKSTDIIEALVHLGGSSGGARPKIFVGYNQDTNHMIHGQGILPDGYEHWIIKFASSSDPIDIAQIEYAYYKMAIDAGINMSHCRLFEGASGKQYFGTKRFDRLGNHRIHTHSAAGLMHDNYKLSNMDYGHVMDAAFRLENHVEAYNKVLRLAAFNIYTHNRDDHSKNISFLMDHNGDWRLAPAYDLTFSMSSHGFHSITIAGEGRSPNSQHLKELAKIFGVIKAENIIDQVKDVTQNWNDYAKDCGVEKESKRLINKTLKAISQLGNR